MGWRNAATGARVDVHPTHWRPWNTDENDPDALRDPN